MRVVTVVIVFLVLPSCVAKLDVPSDAKVTCTVTQPQCPDGSVCDGVLELCLPITPPSGAGPQVSGDVTITPASVGPHQRFSVTFSTDHPLLGEPALSIVSGAFSAELTYVSGTDAGPFVFSYETSGGEAEGVATIRGTLADTQGRVSRDLAIGTVEIDFTPPLVDTIDVDEAVYVSGRWWVDTATITLRPSLPVGSEPPATVSISGDVDASAELAYAATLPTTLTPGDGSKVVQVVLADSAGNVTAVPVLLSLETSNPTNTVIVDTPEPPDVYVNADSLTVFFHSTGAYPADFADYVFSVDSGVTWTAAPTLGALALSTVPADTTTTLWVRERDLFGNMTPQASQGVLAIHEDSQPPSTPHAFTNLVSGLLTSEVGVLLSAAQDPGGGPLTYEILGGPYADYTAVATEPRIVLPGAASGSSTVYVIRAVDRAGNASSSVTVTVADTPFRAITTSCSDCYNTDFSAGSGLGTFTTQDHHANQNLCTAASDICRHHELNLCRRAAVDTFECSSKIVYTNTSGNSILQAPNMGGLVLAFADFTSQLAPVVKAMYVGADEALSTSDDGAIMTIGNGNCQVGTPYGVFYSNDSNNDRLTFYNYGADQRPGTSDSGEGTVVVSAGSVVFGFNPCKLQASTRHVLWGDQRSASTRNYVFNLGNDGKPGGGDDGGEWLIPAGDIALLGDDRILVSIDGGDWDVYDAGPDHVFGNTDDQPVVHVLDIPTLVDADGDKAYFTDLHGGMRDLTTGVTVDVNNFNYGGAEPTSLSANGTMLFGGVSFAGSLSRAAAYSVHGEPLTFQVADESGEQGPSGTVAGSFYAFLDGSEARPTLLNIVDGGYLRLEPNVTTLADMDIDDEGYFTWVDQTTKKVMIYYAGADGIPGTSDDKGPTQITSSGTFHWPRVDNRVVVWGDLSLDASGVWYDTDLDSRLKGLALGSDGWVGGGDDITYDFTVAGTRAVAPDISAGTIVYADYADDPNDLCDGSRGAAPDTNCQPSIAVLPIGGARTVIATGGTPRADLRIEGNVVLFSELTSDWNVRMHTLGGATVSLTTSSANERLPVLIGNTLAYYAESSTVGAAGVFVVNRGLDATFGTTDDIVYHRPANVKPRACADACGTWDANIRWFDGEMTASGGGLMPVDTTFDTATGSSGVALVDNGTFTDSATLTAPTWQHIEDLRVHVQLTHAVPSQLEIRLVSPSGERLVLSSTVTGVSGVIDVTYTVENAPKLFGLHADPLAGSWQLEVQDKVTGTTGTLTGWSITHRR